jgi:putative flavoprotein involved in K+ transport
MQPTHDVVIIGAGQAGLATAYYFQQMGVSTLLLEAASTIGEVWRGRTFFGTPQAAHLLIH